jgi:fructose-1,6-bisphosphatase I
MASINGSGEGGAVGQERINTEIVTLTRFLTEEQTKHKEATGDFTSVTSKTSIQLMVLTDSSLLCHALQFSFKSIAYYIRRATLINVRMTNYETDSNNQTDGWID